MATDCPGCFTQPSQASDSTSLLSFELAPKINWPDLNHLHQTPESYNSFCEAIDRCDTHLSASIETIRKTLLHLRVLRNSRGLARRLPPELLVHIFSEVVLASDPPSSNNLVAATHVCRYWRAIALDSPALWTAITGINASRLETFVQRSQDALLDIHFNLGRSIHSDVLQIPHFRILKFGVVHNRLRSLTAIAGAIHLLDKLVEQLVSRPAPHLTALHLLRGSGEALQDSYYHRAAPCHIYRNMDIHPARTPTPALRSLRLHPSFLSWRSDIFKNLSVLDVEAHQRALGLPNERGMLGVLRDCPSLVELRLCFKGNFPGPSVSSTDRMHDVTLPHLSTLSLEEFSPAGVANFLSHLTLPACTRYNLHLNQPGSDYTYPYFPRVFPEDLVRFPAIPTTKAAQLDFDKDSLLRVYPTGTHDTMAFYGWPISQCQSPTTPLSVQLHAGIRVLDVRLAVVDGRLIAYHGIYPQRTPFQDILRDIHGFLTAAPTRRETLVMSIKQEDFAQTPLPFFSQCVHDEITNGPGGLAMWCLENRIPTLGEVRGRVVLLSRFGGDGSGWEGGLEGLGIHPTAWPDSEKDGFTWTLKGTLVRTHDWYSIPSFLSIPEKTELATQILLPPPNNPPFPVLNITYFSAASFPLAFPPTIAKGFGWPKWGFGVEGVNGRVGKWLLDQLSGDGEEKQGGEDVRIRGWAFMDYYVEPEDGAIVPLLVECNYRGRKKGEEGWK